MEGLFVGLMYPTLKGIWLIAACEAVQELYERVFPSQSGRLEKYEVLPFRQIKGMFDMCNVVILYTVENDVYAASIISSCFVELFIDNILKVWLRSRRAQICERFARLAFLSKPWDDHYKRRTAVEMCAVQETEKLVVIAAAIVCALFSNLTFPGKVDGSYSRIISGILARLAIFLAAEFIVDAAASRALIRLFDVNVYEMKRRKHVVVPIFGAAIVLATASWTTVLGYVYNFTQS